MVLLDKFFNHVISLTCDHNATLEGICSIDNEDVKEICYNLKDSGYEIYFKGGISIGCKVSFNLEANSNTSLDYVEYANYQDFFEHEDWSEQDLPNFNNILWHRWASGKEVDGYIDDETLRLVCNLAFKLKKLFYSHQEKVVFFSKKAVEMDLEIDDLSKFIQNLSCFGIEKHKKISDFIQWFDENNENEKIHTEEKKTILALKISELFSEPKKDGYDYSDFLEKFDEIDKEVRGQYILYVENFSYNKFVDKLEDNTQKFIDRINNTVNKIVPQFLALPFMTAIPVALGKASESCITYLAALAYCVICFYALNNQKVLLQHINEDVNNFEEKGKIPDALKNDWENDKNRILNLVKKQNTLYKVLRRVLCIFALYAIYNIVIIMGRNLFLTL